MLKLNTTRSYPFPVTVHYYDENGRAQQGKFNAQFKVVPADQLQDDENADKRLLDIVLLGVDKLELVDVDNNVLEGDALLDACKNDPSISTALVNAYHASIAKKNRART
jgi:hypothetical protein